jgi:hypothetical protein
MKLKVKGTAVLDDGSEQEVDVWLDIEERRRPPKTGVHILYGVFDSWTAEVPATPLPGEGEG